ncbi:DUF397 domain-containing protein [Streptomyces lydicus]|uniref:DUF397 domain-containing protein n=1 Tax=Streptomyces lydicus TaxID=47763 RepID=UPI0037B64A23
MNTDVDEVLTWRTSSYSSGEGGQCVEVALLPHVVRVRDSKDIGQPAISATAAAWAAFVGFAAQ